MAEVIAMLTRDKGATAEEMVERFGCKGIHVARGFLSILGSKHGVKIKRVAEEKRGNVYHA